MKLKPSRSLRTLKDFKRYTRRATKFKVGDRNKGDGCITVVNYNELKAEAIKWVKEEIKITGSIHFCIRWMKRLNITEEDLK